MQLIDTDKKYRVDGRPGIAWRVLGYVQEMSEPEWELSCCEDEEVQDMCDHSSDMCWIFKQPELIDDFSMVRAVMVGDDEIHEISAFDLVPIEDDEYCHECGQIGCGW
jgi:hypothetical protein